MRRPGDHGLQDQVSAAGPGGAGPGEGRRGRARAAGQGLQASGRAGDLLPGPKGLPPCRRHAGRGTVAMTIQGGAGAGWKGAGGQLSPPHLRAGTAEITRWPPPRGYREPLKMVTQLLGGGREISRSNSPNGCLGRP